MFVITGFAIGITICASSPNYLALLIGRIITGAFAGNLVALVLSLVGDMISKSRSGTATSIVMSGFSIASVVSIPVGLYLSHEIAWSTPFNIISSLSLTCLICTYLFFPNVGNQLPQKTIVNPMNIIRIVFSDKKLFKALLFMFFLVASGFSIMLFIGPFLRFNIGITQAELGSIYLLSGLGSIISGPFIGKIIDRFGEDKVFIASALISVITTTAITSINSLDKYISMMLAILFFIFQNSRYISATSLLTSCIGSENRGSFIGINSSLQQLTGGLSALLAGWILSDSGTGRLLNFEVVGVISVMCTLISILISCRIKSNI
jgi:predicted MFS family arabinose efflux permease